jgi:hypothetical protein
VVTVFSTTPRDAEAKRLIAEHKTLASLDKEVAEWHETQPEPPAPQLIEHPIEPGDSQLLGGAMEIKAPWKRD